MTDTDRPHAAVIASIVARGLPRLAPGGGPLPEPAPADPSARPEWEAEVALRRARHDAAALAASAYYDAVLEDSLGADPLGADERPVQTSWASAPVPGGTVGLRVYRPAGEGRLPVVALVHGGAYWMGGGAAGWHLNDTLSRELAGRLPAVVVGIDHRLAPEHPYPIPADDVAAAISWIVGHAAELGADAARLVLFGISSGGNLAAAAAHRALDGELPPPVAVVLQCPSVDLSLGSGRFQADEESIADARRIVALYTAGADPEEPGVSPARRSDLSGSSPTLVITGDYDPLAPDALAYADRLEQAGVAVARHRYPMTHTVATPEVFRRMHDETLAWLGRVLA
ncbi:alpha/beta hydrolase [Microbacterium lushaniae]|uniref:Alpha/beta hydrolase n=1 Tax=Microbacterium lushaniae TaxID=2614639 RepID=A0A5J6L5Y8_9MICO|nr:alpha/beta hydrolase [Microbacterium lushaniae]QEW04079.1 alpha/beta hydrolase [Microbacterium lushaniae]